MILSISLDHILYLVLFNLIYIYQKWWNIFQIGIHHKIYSLRSEMGLLFESSLPDNKYKSWTLDHFWMDDLQVFFRATPTPNPLLASHPPNSTHDN